MNEAEDITLVNPKSSKYSAGENVVLKNGTAGKILGIDPVNNEYQIMTIDNKNIKVNGTDIEKLEKPKDRDYQEAGVDPEDHTKLNIKNTPFDLENDK